jgi:hypothetical protein
VYIAVKGDLDLGNCICRDVEFSQTHNSAIYSNVPLFDVLNLNILLLLSDKNSVIDGSICCACVSLL